MKHLQLIPQGTSFKFVGKRKMAFVGSGLAVIASIFLFFSQGLNLGIDFLGGTVIEIKTEGPADVDLLREATANLGLGTITIQNFGAPDRVMIRVGLQQDIEAPAVPPNGDEVVDEAAERESAQQKVVEIVRAALDANYPGAISYERTDVVGPTVSGELVKTSTIAVVLAVMLMLVYIWFRFEWQFSLGAIVALTHDVILTIGVFCLTQIEFNLPIIAAILTIVGYSMNDTVVVYDRVRENLRKYKKKPLEELLDQSINDTLSRTVMTSVTTLLALGSLYVFGGEALRGFTFAMMWGVFVGTYSSIFVAAPMLVISGVKRDWSKEAANKAGTQPDFS
jgi:preprotein translocase SecF subunit